MPACRHNKAPFPSIRLTMTDFTPALRARLASVSTATLTTCLFKRGFRNQMIQGVLPLNPDAPRLVGPAYTLRYIPAREDLDLLSGFADRSHPQRKGVEECPEGHVFVIDSRGDARAASAGGILVARLWQRGCAGVVTDGGFRDSAEIAKLPFPSYHQRPSAPTNLTLHHAADLNVPIGCGGAPVYPGDIIVGDADGVLVLPRHLAQELADEAFEMTAFEDFVEEKVREQRSIFGLYPPDEATRAEFAVWRQQRGR
jgi:regulator of RNase E activity RraA